MTQGREKGLRPIRKLSLYGNPLVEKHGDSSQQVEHEHDTDSNQHNAGADFNQANVLTEPLESAQKLVEEKAREQERNSQPQGIDRK